MIQVDWATAKAASYACRYWHYSHCVPAGRSVKIGVWEDGTFIGVVIFSRGANHHIGVDFGLTQTEACELSRVALKAHKAPVSQIISVAVRFFRTASPGTRLIVSYADTGQHHHGGIYQALGWVYDGLSDTTRYLAAKGEVLHGKTVATRWHTHRIKWLKANVDPNAAWVKAPAKHRYLKALDAEIAAKLTPRAKPYPKPMREKQAMAGHPSAQRRCSADPHAPS